MLEEDSIRYSTELMISVADKVMNHQPLIISGSDDFKKAVINTAIWDDLPFSFADSDIQDLFIHQKKLILNLPNDTIPSHLLRLLTDKQLLSNLPLHIM